LAAACRRGGAVFLARARSARLMRSRPPLMMRLVAVVRRWKRAGASALRQFKNTNYRKQQQQRRRRAPEACNMCEWLSVLFATPARAAAIDVVAVVVVVVAVSQRRRRMFLCV
jgi:hypothetical protein